MKKLTICAVAVSGLFAAQANAGDVQLVGFVAPVCEVSGLYTQLLDFGQVSSIQSVSTDLSIQCNDADGATVTLTSAEGGLESDDKEDYAIGYTATLSPDSHADLVLTTLGGPGANDVSASMSYSGSLALAGGVSTSLSVTTNETMGWSGGYSDTLTVQVTAN